MSTSAHAVFHEAEDTCWLDLHTRLLRWYCARQETLVFAPIALVPLAPPCFQRLVRAGALGTELKQRLTVRSGKARTQWQRMWMAS